MNLLSIGASFGVITWIFANGHLEGPLGFTSTGFLDATQPIFMLAILVGLSMDYEVFLLSRIREQWDLTHDNTLSVATGVQRTGRIITSAALLLAVVIGAFSTSGIVFMKMIGIGMLVALLVDATIVRMLLVPATMQLLGDWNWWAPRGCVAGGSGTACARAIQHTRTPRRTLPRTGSPPLPGEPTRCRTPALG